jgi:hypothetical protein
VKRTPLRRKPRPIPASGPLNVKKWKRAARKPLATSATPMKRTPLRRKTPLVASQPTLVASTNPLRRTPLRQQSERRRRVNTARKMLQVAAWGPEPWPCALRNIIGTRCFGRVSGHEILSRARAGRTDANLLDVAGQLPACTRHNDWCEEHPNEAIALGLVKHSWDA